MKIDENRFVCIHGHFYQPPRENPWIEEIELEESAAPFTNWNERINNECYGPNAYARILDKDGKITKIKNNYEKISFNFGPTLISWLEKKAPSVYSKIIEADENSKKFNNGHGNAIAQIYNHIIMPLALKRDKETEIIWGIRSFEKDFKRKPEGMWLSETAIDLETIELLIDNGIKFIILAPHQAKKIRRIGESEWVDTDRNSLDTKRAYKLNISDDKSIAIFFFDNRLSTDIAFNGILKEGIRFIDRIVSSFDPSNGAPQLVNAATDGESYGHHKKFAEMALAYALEHIENRKLARIINYGYFLELFPPEFEVKIIENTSWSDSQGIERWRSDLGDSILKKPGWNQKWRTPLRDAMNFLKDKADALYEKEISKYLQDPWGARNDYINVILNRTDEEREKFVSIYIEHVLSPTESHKVFSLMEMQRNALLMFTSCGWFFDDLDRIEPKQILKYAIRVIQIAKEFDWDLEKEYKEIMKSARSNAPSYKTGDIIYEEVKKKHMVNFERAISNYALLGTMFPMENKYELYVYKINCYDKINLDFGYTKFVLGYLEIFSNLTYHFEKAMFIGAKFERAFLAGAKLLKDFDEYEKNKALLIDILEIESMAEVIRNIDHVFEDKVFGITDLFFKERKEFLNKHITANFVFLDTEFNQFYQTNLKFMKYLKNISVEIPDKFKLVLEYVLNQDLTQQFREFLKEKNYQDLKKILKEAEYWGIELNTQRLDKEITRSIIELLKAIKKISLKHSDAGTYLEKIEEALDFAVKYKLKIILWEIQNEFIEIIEENIELLKEIKRMKRSEIDFKFIQILSLINTIGMNLNLDIEIIMQTIIGNKMI
ncbi:MAG: DUF3536 domain-containing protein [Candidatus Helarchaeota archaeon]